MINNKKCLAIIPARGGSKGVPRKNIREIAGKPLIAWTIEEAKKSKYIDRLVLSSEDSEIMEIARIHGCDVPFVRPAHLAQDETSSMDMVFHVLNELPDYDYVVLLQPTSPLRSIEDIDGCIDVMLGLDAPSCVSMTEPEKSPYWMYTLQENHRLQPLIPEEPTASRRQDLRKAYALNGAVYAASVDLLVEAKSFVTNDTVAYIMPKNRSYDIDTEEDFLICDLLMKNKLSHQ
ncbi:acylneuraminate cytidylyltransferase [Paenibacillus sp. FSL A5-0031]|uniref:acylneuraminate cytidylyltransferase family protein n=1 Tax=Paenibacillus sp. FSL A5-0031 TaxID=1920420 RepID=UPI00096C6FE6|nr:acylneuraminate cytidylyltransferase family protein [Paenibacillus sp. FSL A5-0031]OME87131.1 acylneuraminate cytidylyltransferase [Paenibacillus sp. FSL A5-0031]